MPKGKSAAVPSVGRKSTAVQINKTQRRRGPAPKPPMGVVETTGACLLNSSASTWAVDLARGQGLEKFEFVMGFRADEENGAVGLYPEAPGTPNCVMFRWTNKDRQISVHLGDVFAKHPDLRPEFKVDCKVSVEMEQELGRECLWITTWGALRHEPKSRKKKKTQPPAPAAEGQAGPHSSSATAGE